MSVRTDGTQRDNRHKLRVAAGGGKAIMKGARAMSDYIKREDAIKELKRAHKKVLGYAEEKTLTLAEEIIEDIPSADIEPVRHGWWKHKNNIYGAVYCSECDYELTMNNTNYCPNCGARMRMTKEQYESHVGDIYEDGESDE